MADHNERRRAQRVDANLNLEVKLPQADGSISTASLETINISTSGVYFRSDHFIEPMTKLGMELEVTVPAADGGAPGSALVPCEGLVVRSNPEAAVAGCTDYEIAVFFTHIEADGMANLERHIALLLSDLD
ncbi:PilZ domain-containing protein [bacterium]|nr:PilZ domain-containing protein [bacterium]